MSDEAWPEHTTGSQAARENRVMMQAPKKPLGMVQFIVWMAIQTACLLWAAAYWVSGVNGDVRAVKQDNAQIHKELDAAKAEVRRIDLEGSYNWRATSAYTAADKTKLEQRLDKISNDMEVIKSAVIRLETKYDGR